jgi:hypothetical protein
MFSVCLMYEAYLLLLGKDSMKHNTLSTTLAIHRSLSSLCDVCGRGTTVG